MGNALSNMLIEIPLVEFRKLDPSTRVEDVEVPAPAKERKVTDKKGFAITAILMIILLSFIIYAFVKSDLRRLYHGMDSCGNLCGVKNPKLPGIECSGKDYSNKRYEILILATNATYCSDDCDLKPTGRTRYNEDGRGIIPKIFGNIFSWQQLRDFEEFVLESSWKVPISWSITILLTIGTLFLFRYFAVVMCWSALVLLLLMLLALEVFAWVSYQWDEEHRIWTNIGGPIVSTLLFGLLLFVMVVLRKKVKLMIQIFEETGKALFAMPLLVFLPFFTLLLQFIAFALWLLTTIVMLTVGEFSIDRYGNFRFGGSKVMIFGVLFNTIMLMWTLIFFVGSQYMVIAGSVAQWFFKKRKGTSAVCRSFSISIKYHLGTVLFGTFLLTTVWVIKMIILSATANDRTRKWVEDLIENIEALIKFLSQNAYAETAIHGQSFFRSGKRGVNLLLTHLVSLLVVNCAGDFILAVVMFLLIGIGTLIAYALFMNDNHVLIGVIMCLVFNIIIVVTVFETFEGIIDTIFLCFCEDITINDGVGRPYCMSDNLRKFVDRTDEMHKKEEEARAKC